ncbi:hypothetical protein ACFOE1_07045 [Agromyces mediolanus]|uniref:Uncharacterized protein n=1 Tax=Agromyces mediolanus TaxID=41986 RepID=A0A918FDW4_AGRME|nr:hypothetical protein [Agromyces mediolanus]GGR26373.1 hypothetical protein GCM10010196_19840 [Agromyces mediolanus]GLJ71778.1 hypothetical protein GCM10017583_10340 [Agromyces mediolanus]
MKLSRAFAGAVLLGFSCGLMVTQSAPAVALGTRTVSCVYNPPGTGYVTGYSWRNSDFSGGAYTNKTPDCTALTLSVRVKYQSYPGGPYYWTGFSYGSSSVTQYQSGTSDGEHGVSGQGVFST